MIRFTFIILSALFFTLTINANEKPNVRMAEVGCVYSTRPSVFELISMQHSDTATTLFLCCHAIPGEAVCIPQDLCLMDMNQKYYHMLSSEYLIPGTPGKCPLNGDLKFSLSFEPLDDCQDYFDLLSLSEDKKTFAFWGIHTKNKKLKPYKDSYHNWTDTTWLNVGYTQVKGKFTHTETGQMPDSIRIINTFFNTSAVKAENEDNTCKWKPVNQDGTFEINVVTDGISWGYVEVPGRDIPVMLYPNDTLLLEIDNSEKFLYNTTYRSARGNNEMAHLMNADPRMTNTLYLTESCHEPARPDVLSQMCQKERGRLTSLLTYLVAKYELSETEAHLMRLYLETQVDAYQSMRISKAANAIYNHPSFFDNALKHNNIPESVVQELLPHLDYLRKIDLRDMSHYVIPDKKGIMLVYHLPLFGLIPTHQDLIHTLLEEYLGCSFPGFWMNAMSYYFSWKF